MLYEVITKDISRFAQFASRVWNIDNDFFDQVGTALRGIEAYEKFIHSIGLSTRLSDIGIDAKRFQEMALKATNGGQGTLGSFMKLAKDDVFNIFELAK